MGGNSQYCEVKDMKQRIALVKDVSLDQEDALYDLLRGIRGVANCIEAAARETSSPHARSRPEDDAIPAACTVIARLCEEAGALFNIQVRE